jgi:hypothetical protein
MVVDTNGYDVMLGLDILIKIGAIVDIKRQIIQVHYGSSSDVQMLPLIMIYMLQWINKNLGSKFQELQIQDDSNKKANKRTSSNETFLVL